MDSVDGWTVVTTVKKPSVTKRVRKDEIIDEKTALEMEKKLNIDYLAEALSSDESVEIQKEGYRFLKLLRRGENIEFHQTNDKKLLPINNKWNDIIVFKLSSSE